MIFDYKNRQFLIALTIRDSLVAPESAHLSPRDRCHHGSLALCGHIDRIIAGSHEIASLFLCQPHEHDRFDTKRIKQGTRHHEQKDKQGLGVFII